MRWFIYEDLVYYSAYDDSWRDYYYIWGSDSFPTTHTPPEQPPASTTSQVIFNMGDATKTLSVSGSSLNSIIQLLSAMKQEESKEMSEREIEEMIQKKQELFKILGVPQKSLFHNTKKEEEEEVIDGNGYLVKHYTFLNEAQSMIIRRKEDAKYEIAFRLFFLLFYFDGVDKQVD